LAFARCMGEFGATIMIAGSIPGATRTIPLHIYAQLESPGGFAESWRLVAVAIGLSFVALVVAEWLERRGRQRLTGQAR